MGQRQASPDGAEPHVPAKELTFILEQLEAQAALWLPAAQELQGWAGARARSRAFSSDPLLTHIYCPLAQQGLWKSQSLKYMLFPFIH